MAHHVLGIDLGAYSVKVMVVQPGLRHSTAVNFFERPVPDGDEPHEIRAARVLGQIMRANKLDGDSAYAAAPGDKLFIHVLEFPFRNVKRHILESAVGGELENVLPIDLEDMVFSFQTLPSNVARPREEHVDEPAAPMAASSTSGFDDDEPTNVQVPPRARVVHGRVAEQTTGMRILACTMELGQARTLLSTMTSDAVEPRGLVAAPASYARIAERLTRLSPYQTSQSGRGASLGHPVAIVDIGHRRTDICITRGGNVIYARTLPRAGFHLTETLSRAWSVSESEAERAKIKHGFIASESVPAPTREQQRIHDAVVAEIGPLAKDLQRTLSSCLAKTGAAVGQVVLVGGGSRLRGLAPYLSEKLRIPVSTLTAADANDVLGSKLASMGVPPDIACLAAGIGYECGAGRPRFDLRQGELAYKADLSFLRQKASVLVALAILVIGFAVANGFAAHYKLRQAHAALSQRLALETTLVFGEAKSASDTLDLTEGVVSQDKKSPLPKMTTYDVLLDINKHLPASDKLTLDVRELDIKDDNVMMKASAKSAAEIDLLQENLEKIKCFKKVNRGKVSVGTNDVYDFTFNINSSCM